MSYSSNNGFSIFNHITFTLSIDGAINKPNPSDNVSITQGILINSTNYVLSSQVGIFFVEWPISILWALSFPDISQKAVRLHYESN